MNNDIVNLKKLSKHLYKLIHKNFKNIEYTLSRDNRFKRLIKNTEFLINELQIIVNLMINIDLRKYKEEEINVKDELVKVYFISNKSTYNRINLDYFKIFDSFYVIKDIINLKFEIEKLIKFWIRILNIKIIFNLYTNKTKNIYKLKSYLLNIIKNYKNLDNQNLNLDIMRAYLTINLVYIKENNTEMIKKTYGEFLNVFNIHSCFKKLTKSKNNKKSEKNKLKCYKFLIIIHIQLFIYYKEHQELELSLSCLNLILYLIFNLLGVLKKDTILYYGNRVFKVINGQGLFEFLEKYSIFFKIFDIFYSSEKNIYKKEIKSGLDFYFNNFDNKFNILKYNSLNQKFKIINNKKKKKINFLKLYTSKDKWVPKNFFSTNFTSSNKSNQIKTWYKAKQRQKILVKKPTSQLFNNFKNFKSKSLVNKKLSEPYLDYKKHLEDNLQIKKAELNCNLKFVGEEIKFVKKLKNTKVKKESEINNYYSNLVYNTFNKDVNINDIEDIKIKKLIRNEYEAFEKRDILNCKKILTNKSKNRIKTNISNFNNNICFTNKINNKLKIEKIKDNYSEKQRKKEIWKENILIRKNTVLEPNSWKNILIKNNTIFKIDKFLRKNRKGIFNYTIPKKPVFDKQNEFLKLQLVN